MRISFRQKLFISLLALSMIPLFVLGVNAYNIAQRTLRLQAEAGFLQTAREAAMSLNARIEALQKTLTFIVGDYELTASLHNEEPSYYARYANIMSVLRSRFGIAEAGNPELEELSIYSANGLINYQTDEIQTIKEAESFPWYTETMGKNGMVWSADSEGITGVYHLLKPTRSAPDNLLTGHIKTGDLLWDNGLRELDHDIMILSGGGIVIPFQNVTTQNAYIDAGLPDALPANMELDGYFLSAEQLPVNGWTLIFAVPKENLIQNPVSILWGTGGLLLLVLAGVALLSLLLSRTLTRRILALNESMREIEAGNLHAEIKLGPDDEVGQLTRQFKTMLDYLIYLIDDVYKNNLLRREAELTALYAQIKPHFLYNTLSLIHWMALREGAEEISILATNMTVYYRTMLNRGQRYITLEGELDNVRAYCGIQLIAQKSSFDVEYQVDESLLSLLMVNMVLQPLVENSIKHGINLLEGVRGRIVISADIEGEFLLLTVEDNGVGMDAETAQGMFAHPASGYGISNIQDRIVLDGGDAYGISVASEKGKGTCVKVRLPIRTQQE